MFLLSSFGVINMRDLVGMAHGKCCSDFQAQFLPSLIVLFFSLIFLLFRWREVYFNGAGRWVFKKTGVRKTTVIASIIFLTELVLFFTEMMPEHSLPSSAQTRAIPSVARPILIARMKGYVMTILNNMISCFRSNYRSTESGLKKYVINAESCCFGSDMGV